MDRVTATAQMTAAEFLALPEDPGRRWELIDGELVVSEPTRMHNESQGCIYAALRTWARAAADRGWVGLPLDVQLDETNVHVPDVAWYRRERAPRRGDPVPYPVPDLAVEVRSASTWRFNIGRKKQNYERFGVGELWLVDTAANVVFAFRRSVADVTRFDISIEFNAGEALTSPLLPGFSLPVNEIFELG
jgi:Uma2 family endonuclease